MNLKEQYKNQIDELSSKSFNKDQKELAKRILDAAPENEVDKWFQLLIQKVKLGFTFDSAPEVFQGAISLLEEDKSRRINVGEDVAEDENLLIVGENYDALKNLLITHKNKIDIIYIDPPYNTEKSKEDNNIFSNDDVNAGNKFVYRDKFSRTGWLNMLKERLILAKQLLTDEGVIFVSIDDTEQAYLKVLMDEIFGEENFVSNIYWRSRTSQNYSDKYISDVGEYIVLYAKIKNILPAFNKDKANGGESYSNPDNDPRGAWTSSGIIRNDGRPIYKVKSPTGIEHEQAFLYTKANFLKLESEKRIWWGKNGNAIPRKKSYLNDWNGNPYISAIINSSISNDLAKKMLKKIIDPKLAEKHTPKPIKLIKLFINLINKKNISVLDFFAGSGTTGHAVMELNKEDNGNRKFILVTNNENNIAHNITYERLHRIIKGKGTKNESDFKWLEKNEPYANAKLRVFNINQYQTTLNDDPEELLTKAQVAFKKIDKNYQKENIDIYNDLNSLHPYKKEEDN